MASFMTMSARVHPAEPARSPSSWRWAAAGLCLGLIAALLLLAPARWAAATLSRLTQGRVLLQATEGTFWNGSARLLLAGGEGSAWSVALPTRLSWQIRPASGGVTLQLHSACCTPEPVRALMQARWRGVLVKIFDGTATHWPASLLAGLGTPWNTLQLQGDLELLTQGLEWQSSQEDAALSGRAVLTAHDLVSRLSMGRAVGTYQLTLEGTDTARVRLQTLRGELSLSGTGYLLDSRWHFEGEAHAMPGREEALSSLLNVIGRRQGERSIIQVGQET